MERLRRSVIAGTWYPGNPHILRADIQDLFQRIPMPELGGRLIGLISPHAGYAYSGEVAAYAYKLLKGKSFDSVIIIGPSHRALFQGASVYERGGYETPLGIVPVDAELADRIISRGEHISYIPNGHNQEHSVEIQLPFLQVILGSFRFVPIVMGDQSRKTCEELSRAIVESVAGGNVLIVGSSDLSHYHSDDRARKMDSRVLKRLEEMDVNALFKDLETGSAEACGGGPMAVTMMTAGMLGADTAKILKYANSGDVTGDRSGVVGYAAVAFYSRGMGNRQEKDKETAGKGLSASDKYQLLRIARNAIESRLTGEKKIPTKTETRHLAENMGAFVSLHSKSGRLRGCIGCIEGRMPLSRTVHEMALSAAFNDPRFPPLGREELSKVDIEISVLTPLKEIHDINEIDIGTHGLYLKRGYYAGLLLPQVATQYGWDRITFLEETCRKAGLPPQAWKDKDVKIYIFSADVFAEDH